MILKSPTFDYNFFISKNARLTNRKLPDYCGSNRLTEKKPILNSDKFQIWRSWSWFCFRPILYVWPLQINLSVEEIFWVDKLLKPAICELASVLSISSSLGSQNFLGARSWWQKYFFAFLCKWRKPYYNHN